MSQESNGVADPMSRPAASESTELDEALRQARLKEAAHFEAALDIRDAQTLRLQVLKDDLAPIVASRRQAQEFFDLALILAWLSGFTVGLLALLIAGVLISRIRG